MKINSRTRRAWFAARKGRSSEPGYCCTTISTRACMLEGADTPRIFRGSRISRCSEKDRVLVWISGAWWILNRVDNESCLWPFHSDPYDVSKITAPTPEYKRTSDNHSSEGTIGKYEKIVVGRGNTSVACSLMISDLENSTGVMLLRRNARI